MLLLSDINRSQMFLYPYVGQCQILVPITMLYVNMTIPWSPNFTNKTKVLKVVIRRAKDTDDDEERC